MATTPQSRSSQESLSDLLAPQDDANAVWETVRQALRPVASLKLTVVLFAMSIFIVFAGTMAQVDADIWEVVDKYFRIDTAAIAQGGVFSPWAYFVWIDFQIFAPASFFPSQPDLPAWLGIPFPKGWLIGAVMLLNLFAAHLVRFKVQAADFRLAGGLSVIAIGCLITALVIVSGSSTDGFQTEYWISWSALWGLLQVSLLVAGAAALYGAVVLPRGQGVARCGLGVAAVAFLSVLAWTFLGSVDRFSDSSMRILYQLIKATIPGLVLLAGCIVVFRKRAGIVLLHGGVGLMMLSEVLVGLQAEEAQMRIEEGASRNFVEDIRTVELAFVQTLDDGRETHTVIPGRLLKQEVAISDEELPVDVEVVRFLQNSELFSREQLAGFEERLDKQLTPDETAEIEDRLESGELTPEQRTEYEVLLEEQLTPAQIARFEGIVEDARDLSPLATRGIGLERVAVPVRASTGTDTDGAVDATAAYVRLTDRESGEDLGTWLVSIDFDWFSLGWNEQTFQTDGREYRIELRFKRTYKPYTITLNDIRKEDYIGTNTPRDYSSFVRLQDESNGTDRDDVRIWMNNPLRYGGETFYQSSYYPPNAVYRGSGEWTSLQVVKNTGWMIPYVSCMIVAVGMCAQFGLVLWRFLQRRRREQSQAMASVETLRRETASRRQLQNADGQGTRKQPIDEHSSRETDWAKLVSEWALPAVVVLLCAAWLGSKLRQPETEAGRMDLETFRSLPVVYQGRPKPIDTLARNSLLIVSDRQEFTGRMDPQTWQDNWDEIQQEFLDEWPELTEDDLEPFAEGDRPLASLVGRIADRIEEESDDELSDVERQKVADFVYETTSVRQPAIRWLMDVISPPTGFERAHPAREHRVFRIENLELQATLGLPRRDGFRYAIAEFEDGFPQYMSQLQEAGAVAEADPEQLTFYQRKVLELQTRLEVYQRLSDAFVPPDIPPLPSDELWQSDREQAIAMVGNTLRFAVDESRRLEESGLPLAIPVTVEDEDGEPARTEWQPLSAAILNIYSERILQTYVGDYEASVSESALDLHALIRSYRDGDVEEFNEAVAEYSDSIAAAVPENVDMDKIHFETFFNHAAPFYYSAVLYLFAFLFTCLSWLGPWARPLNRAAFWLIIFTSLVHVLAIIGRIYISGRPPVTNLYSSAVFIGLACVALAMLLEWFSRVGVGNVVASVSGFITLGIAHFLAGDGDTFTVLQAVLDTQFWLATHVVCITVGYATTFVAGLLGLMYLCRRVPLHHLVTQAILWSIVVWMLPASIVAFDFEVGGWQVALTPGMTRAIVSFVGVSVIAASILIDSQIGFQRLSQDAGKSIIRMLYGALCFSIFFSFVGTVLGGLWADDSWGRFWGWDPKENGALIIVLWNALVLHARWDGMVRERGLAILAVIGNIAVSWSWFGVNELGVGLHSYGFTEGVLLTLGLFVLSQITFAAAGCLPENLRFRSRESASA